MSITFETLHRRDFFSRYVADPGPGGATPAALADPVLRRSRAATLIPTKPSSAGRLLRCPLAALGHRHQQAEYDMSTVTYV